LLHNGRPVGDLVAVRNIPHPQADEVTRAQLAPHREVEEREFAGALGDLESYPDRPDLALLEGRFWPTSLPLFQGTRGTGT